MSRRRLWEFGNLESNNSDNAGAAKSNKQILEIVTVDPTFSVRHISSEIGTSTLTIYNALRKECLYLYHYSRVPALLLKDLPRRVQFC